MVRVLVVAGSPCSGKTTFAAVACAMLNGAGNGDGGGRSGACLVDKDTLEWPLANAALAVAGVAPDSHDCPLYVNTLKGAAYETMERVAEQQVKEARCANVVMVAPFSGHVKDPDWQPRLRRRFFGEGAGKGEKTTTIRTTTTTTTTTMTNPLALLRAAARRGKSSLRSLLCLWRQWRKPVVAANRPRVDERTSSRR